MEQLWPNTTHCFDLTTNFTYTKYEAFFQAFWLPIWSFYDRLDHATQAINKTLNGAQVCASAGINFAYFWQRQLDEYQTYGSKYLVLSLSFVQNFFNQLLSVRQLYDAI